MGARFVTPDSSFPNPIELKLYVLGAAPRSSTITWSRVVRKWVGSGSSANEAVTPDQQYVGSIDEGKPEQCPDRRD